MFIPQYNVNFTLQTIAIFEKFCSISVVESITPWRQLSKKLTSQCIWMSDSLLDAGSFIGVLIEYSLFYWVTCILSMQRVDTWKTVLSEMNITSCRVLCNKNFWYNIIVSNVIFPTSHIIHKIIFCVKMYKDKWINYLIFLFTLIYNLKLLMSIMWHVKIAPLLIK